MINGGSHRLHCACVLLAVTVACFLLHFNSFSIYYENPPSSVWCHDHDDGLQCSFQNLYYHPDESFIFLLTPESVVFGLRDPSRLNRIQTSTVANHSEFYLQIETRTQFDARNVFEYRQSLFFLQRFKPDNILHVIHDDLLPLYATYKSICFGNVDECTRRYQLALIDSTYSAGFFEWYAHFSELPPILFTELDRHWFRFADVKIGLLNKIVYQYGIGRVHGPVEDRLCRRDILDFREFILRRFQAGGDVLGFTVVSRRLTRKIVNEYYLTSFIESNLKLRSDFKTNVIDLMTNSSKEVIKAVSSSGLFLAMHGAESILALFLPPNSSVIELFPYGINKNVVSPLLSFSRIQDIHFRYFSWTNVNESNTLTHPNNPPIFGGIRHLSESQRREIEQIKAVPPVVCCHSPLYLFRMFQDTLVDQSIEPVVLKAIESIRVRFETGVSHMNWFVPGLVRDLNCTLRNGRVILNWNAPENINNFTDTRFDVVLKIDKKSQLFRTEFHNLTVEVRNKITLSEAWICCVLGDVKGKDSYVLCSK